MSEQQSEPTSIETGSAGAASEARIEPVMAESPAIAPDQELTAPKPDAPNLEALRAEAPKPEVQAGKTEAPRLSGNVMIMSPGERMWGGDAASATGPARRRRVGAMAAVVALAAIAGAIGGALATSGRGQDNAAPAAAARTGYPPCRCG